MTRKVTINTYYNEDTEPANSVTLEAAAQVMVSGTEGSAVYTIREADHTINVRITGVGGQATTPESGDTKSVSVEVVKETKPDPAPKDTPPVVESEDSGSESKGAKSAEPVSSSSKK